MNLSTQLRAILLIVGVVLLVAIYWLGRRKSAAHSHSVATRSSSDAAAYREIDWRADEFDESQADNAEADEDTAVMEDNRQHGFAPTDSVARLEDDADAALTLPPLYAESGAESGGDDFAHALPGEPAVADSELPAASLTAQPAVQRVEPTLSMDAVATIAPNDQTESFVPTIDESLATARQYASPAAKPSGAATPTLSEVVSEPAATQRAATASSPRAPSSDTHQALANPIAGKPTNKPASRRKIIALRLATGAVSGEQLLNLLHGEKLQHGKFNIFHRTHAGETVFSVASMIEPGSFDLASMAEQQFPGVTLFMLLPGPLDGLIAFDQMLSCAQRVAHALEGVLQDERGSKLLPQGLERLREEVLDFQHLLGGADVSV